MQDIFFLAISGIAFLILFALVKGVERLRLGANDE
jgi:hypothetical protein